MSIESYYVAGITVKNLTETRGSGGQTVKTYSAGTDISGRIRKLTGAEIIVADKDAFTADYRLYCAPAEVISSGDQVEYDSKTFSVVSVNDVMEMGKHLQVDLKRR